MSKSSDEMGAWFAREIVANEVAFTNPVPRGFRLPAMREMVDNPLIGWPDDESALAFLDEMYDWSP